MEFRLTSFWEGYGLEVLYKGNKWLGTKNSLTRMHTLSTRERLQPRRMKHPPMLYLRSRSISKQYSRPASLSNLPSTHSNIAYAFRLTGKLPFSVFGQHGAR